jgi:hypothetical protein
MKYFVIVLTLVLYARNGNSQDAKDSVKMVINKMFTAMKNADGAMLKSCFSDSVIFQSISRSKEGKTIVRSEDANAFVESISKAKPGSLDEQIEFEAIEIDGPLAIAWTPYKFYFDGKFSHCGANSFQLVRFNGEWKIQYLIDTRRRTGCEN